MSWIIALHISLKFDWIRVISCYGNNSTFTYIEIAYAQNINILPLDYMHPISYIKLNVLFEQL